MVVYAIKDTLSQFKNVINAITNVKLVNMTVITVYYALKIEIFQIIVHVLMVILKILVYNVNHVILNANFVN